MNVLKQWKSITLAILIVVLNLILITQIVGLSYASFDWLHFANAYGPQVGKISGVVTAPGGAPLANIKAFAYASPWVPGGFGTATTDASGNYTINNLPVGTYKILFWDPSGGHTYLNFMTIPAIGTKLLSSQLMRIAPLLESTCHSLLFQFNHHWSLLSQNVVRSGLTRTRARSKYGFTVGWMSLSQEMFPVRVGGRQRA
jgi:hypothetical protein